MLIYTREFSKKDSEYSFYLKGGKGGISTADGIPMDDHLICSFIAGDSEEAILEVTTDELDFGKPANQEHRRLKLKTLVMQNLREKRLLE
ncbi:MAG: hypothetical protein R2883_02980 [Caldisericia bacterium]